MLETCVICVLVSLPQCGLPIVKAFKARLDIKNSLLTMSHFFERLVHLLFLEIQKVNLSSMNKHMKTSPLMY